MVVEVSWVQIWIRIRQNDADPSDTDPQHGLKAFKVKMIESTYRCEGVIQITYLLCILYENEKIKDH